MCALCRNLLALLFVVSCAFATPSVFAEGVPYLSANFSKLLGPTPPKLVGANEYIEFNLTPAGLVNVSKTVLRNGRVASVETVMSTPCGDCSNPWMRWFDSNRSAVLTINDNSIDRVWLLGQSESGQWHSVEVTDRMRTDRTDYLLFNDAVVAVDPAEIDFTTTPNSIATDALNLAEWHLSNSGWSQVSQTIIPPDILGLSYWRNCCHSGSIDSFVVANAESKTIDSYKTVNGRSERVQSIRLEGIGLSDNITAIDLYGDTLLVEVANQDYDYPNQGVVHILRKTQDGGFQAEAVAPRLTQEYEIWESTFGSTGLVSEDVALVEKRIYQRHSDGNWKYVAGINSVSSIVDVATDGTTLTWVETEDSRSPLYINVSDWRPSPVCERIGGDGWGTFMNSPCRVKPVETAGSQDGLKPSSLLNADRLFPPFYEFGGIPDARFSYIDDEAIEPINIAVANNTSARIDAKALDVCAVLGYTELDTSCRHTAVATAENHSIVAIQGTATQDNVGVVQSTRNADLYNVDVAANGEFSITKIEISDEKYLIRDIDMHGQYAVAESVNRSGTYVIYVLKRDSSDSWSVIGRIDNVGRLENLKLHNGRIIYTQSIIDKIQIVNITVDDELYYESSIALTDFQPIYEHSWTTDVHNDRIIFGGQRDRNDGKIIIFERSSDGIWSETDRLTGDQYFGRQAFLSHDRIVALSLRDVWVDGSGFLEPTMTIYQPASQGWQLTKSIDHTGHLEITKGRAGFLYNNDTYFPVNVINDTLHLPVKSVQSVDFVAYDISRDAYLNTSNYCVDADADGMGWDGIRACRIGHTLPGSCEDSDGDYWGWDGTRSCRIDPLSKCEDPDGDGWGWNGIRSCWP